MPRVKRQRMFGRNVNLASEHAFRKRAARFILQCLRDTAKRIHKTGDTGVGRANHRPACLNAAKNCVRQMLIRAGRMQKPAVIRYIYQQIRAGIRIDWQHKSSRQLANRVFEADQWCNLDIAIR